MAKKNKVWNHYGLSINVEVVSKYTHKEFVAKFGTYLGDRTNSAYEEITGKKLKRSSKSSEDS